MTETLSDFFHFGFCGVGKMQLLDLAEKTLVQHELPRNADLWREQDCDWQDGDVDTKNRNGICWLRPRSIARAKHAVLVLCRLIVPWTRTLNHHIDLSPRILLGFAGRSK